VNTTPATAEKTRIKYEGTRAVLLCYAVVVSTLLVFVTGMLYYDLNSMSAEYIIYMCFTDQCPTLWNVFTTVAKAIFFYLSPAFLISTAAAIFVDAKR